MPNRSTIPNHFEMWPADIELELSSWFKHPSHHGLGEEVVIWHTHPSGNVGPSPSDREQRIPDLANLIVAVTEDEKPIATFF
jgi:proteasome lid subunit RPN8/RPN11